MSALVHEREPHASHVGLWQWLLRQLRRLFSLDAPPTRREKRAERRRLLREDTLAAADLERAQRPAPTAEIPREATLDDQARIRGERDGEVGPGSRGERRRLEASK